MRFRPLLPFRLIVIVLICRTLAPPVRGAAAFNYTPLDPADIVSASVTVDLAELTAHRTIGGHEVNMFQLLDVSPANLPPLDLSDQLFGTAAFPNPTTIDQAAKVTGLFTVDIDASFFPALASGGVGLWALFTDTQDAVFAIDTIYLTVTTASESIQAFYGSPNDGYGIGVADNGILPAALPDGLSATGTGFDEPISSKSIHVPEPATATMLLVGALWLMRRRRRPRDKSPAGHRFGQPTALRALTLALSGAGVGGLWAPASRAQQPAQPPRLSDAVEALGIAAGPAEDARDRRNAATPDDMPGTPHVPGEVLVIFEELEAYLAAPLLESIGAVELAYFQHVGVHHVAVPPGWSVAETVVFLSQQPGVVAVSPNYIRYPADHLRQPNDPSYPQQWYLNNRGRNLVGAAGIAGPARGVIDADIDAPQAWEHGADCSNEIVAVFDAGVDVAHRDFGGNAPGGNIWVNPGDNTADGNDNDGNGVVDDVNGANFTAVERHTERQEVFNDRRELWTDNDGNGLPSAGDTIYVDADLDGRVSAPDVVITGPAQPNGTQFIVFGPLLHTENVGANNRFDAGEAIYFDNGATPNQVDAGDTLLFGPAQPNGSALIGFRVSNGVFEADEPIYADNDLDQVVGAADQVLTGAAVSNEAFLSTFQAAVMHAENVNANGVYDNGEAIYLDVGANPNQVDAGDNLLLGPAQANGTALIAMVVGDGKFVRGETIYVDLDGENTVTAGDTLVTGPAVPNGARLIRFAANEKHADNVTANNVYDNGEAIYRDAGGTPNQVDAGDTLLAGPAQANGAALLPFVIRPDNVITDVTGHGTNVAGIIAARGDNGTDIAGVCWRGRIMTVKIASTDGAEDADFCAGVNYVIDLKKNHGQNVRIVNYSFGGAFFSSVTKACINAAGAEGILFVVAAGNDATDNDPSGQYSETIYLDNDNSGTVTAGDTRLTAFGQPGNVLPAGNVNAGDSDAVAALPLTRLDNLLGGFFRHDESVNANNRFDAGERIYLDVDNNNSVSAGDQRRSFFLSGGMQVGYGTVVAGDPDVTNPLVPFQPNERFADRFMQSFGGRDGFPAGQAATSPCLYDLSNVICVAASTNRDRLASFSAWGIVSVDVVAPGLDILTLRRTSAGGGTEFVPGTSFATPIVAGIFAHAWSLPGYETLSIAELRDLVLNGVGPSGERHAHGVDPRFGLQNTVVTGINHDGRARMVSGADFGDAADNPFPTAGGGFGGNGARHEDIGEEWLGRDPNTVAFFGFPPPVPPSMAGNDVSPEFEVGECCWPPDPDGTSNLDDFGDPDNDKHDDGIDLLGPFTFSPMGGPPNKAKVRVWVSTANNDPNADIDGGRYAGNSDHGANAHNAADGVHRPTDDKHVWVNGWFDWNRDGDWDDTAEHAFMLCVNPGAWVPFNGGAYEVEFDMPTAPADARDGELWARFRLDYGENAGQSTDAANLVHGVGPDFGGRVRYWNDGTGLPLIDPNKKRYESIDGKPPRVDRYQGVAEFGECEDYLLSTSHPDQLHLLGPIPNDLFVGDNGSVIASVQSNNIGLVGKIVTFEKLLGNFTFQNGSNPGGASTAFTTGPDGTATVTFTADDTGLCLIRATVSGTSLAAYSVFEISPSLNPDRPPRMGRDVPVSDPNALPPP